MRRLCGVLFLVGCPEPTEPTVPEQETVNVDAGDDLTVIVGEELRFEGSGTEGEATWDFGDGTFTEGILATHTYAEPGNYVAVLSIVGAGGLRRSDSVRVTAHVRPATPEVVSFTGLGVDAATGDVWVAVPEADAVAVVDPETQTATYLPTCGSPRGVFVADGTAAITCEGSGQLQLVTTASREEERMVNLGAGSRPFGVVGRDGDWWVATQGRGELWELRGASVEPQFYGTDLRAIAVDDNNQVWTTRWRSPNFGGELYGPGGERELALDPGPDTDTGNRGVPNLLESIVVTPDGRTAFIGGVVHNNQRGGFRDGQPLTFETSARATVRVYDLLGGTERLDERKQFDNHDRVSAMTLSPLGNWLWVAHPGTATIHRLDAYTLDIAGAVLDAGIGVNALATSADGDVLYAHAWLDRELRAYDVSEVGRPPTLLWAVPTVDAEPLSATVLEGKMLFHDSADPRLARHGYLNCATCHPDARDDGRVWDFSDRGEGLRNTIPLLGRAGTAMGRLHWSGNFDEVQDFEACIRESQGGSGLLSDADWDIDTIAEPLSDPKAGLSSELDALSAYLESLDELPESPFTHSGDGSLLFTSNGCDVCHGPDNLYTDSSVDEPRRHDVGTWSETSGNRLGSTFREFDTPTLHGVWATPPYLHDGSAPNLATAIGRHEGVDLSPNDLIVLEAWLKTL
jgi:streptogramin lyase